MWKFYWSVIKQLPGLFFQAHERFTSLAALFLFLATLFNQSWLSAIQDGWSGVSPWWSLAVVAGFACFGFFRVIYSQFLSLEQKVEVQGKKIRELEEWLQPKLEIAFGEGGSFEQVNDFGDGSLQRLYRVMVTNLGGTTIQNVRVQLERIEMYDNPFLPVELHQMHDNEAPFSRSFSLNPGQKQYIDVVSKLEGEGCTDAEITLWYAVQSIPNKIPRGAYKLALVATGDNVQPCHEEFNVSVGAEGRLVFSQQ